MAVKDYGTPNKGRQLMFKGKDQSQGLDDKTNYGYNQFAELSDGDPNSSTRLTTHIIEHNAAPGTDFTNAPLGAIFINTANGSVYRKIASAGAVKDWVLLAGMLSGVAAPGTDYTSAPLGTFYMNTAAGTLYYKIASLGAVGDWSLITAVPVV